MLETFFDLVFVAFVIMESESEVAQSLAFWDPVDHSLPCSSIHGIFQARVLEWVAISFSRGSSSGNHFVIIIIILNSLPQRTLPLCLTVN